MVYDLSRFHRTNEKKCILSKVQTSKVSVQKGGLNSKNITEMNFNDDLTIKHCFKCDSKLLNSLNIACNASNSTTVLWNRHQILVYEEITFNSATRIIEPEFQLNRLLLFNNYIACLDCSENIHLISLKFKNPNQKRIKCSFQPRKQNILAITEHNTDFVLTLQYSMDSFYLSFHQINKEFKTEKQFKLLFGKEDAPTIRKQKNCPVKSYSLSDSNLKSITQLFDVKYCAHINYYNLVVMSFDKFTVYACLASSKMPEDEIKLIKMYSCPSEICNIELTENEDLKIVIGLTIGTIITIPLNETDTKPIIIHLNTAISKFLMHKNTLMYTDGCTMWKTDNLFSKDLNLNKFIVKQVKDFVKCYNKIICTTFSNLIYLISNDEASYVKSQNVEEYSSADKLINNTECLSKIMEEIKKNDELVKKLTREENYITALSLSNRQDIMNDIINTKIIVYENYEDADKEYAPLRLTEEISEYFKLDLMFFLINICVNTPHDIFNNIFSNLFTDLKIHISFSTESKSLKTTSIKLGEQLKKINYLIPLKTTSTRISVNIVFVTNIPGAYDEKRTAWTVLYRKNISLNSENFIRSNNVVDKVLHLKKTEVLEDSIIKMAQDVYGLLFKFTNISKSIVKDKEWSLYVKLPTNYPEIFKKSDYCEKYLNSKTLEVLSRQYTSEEFVKSKNNFILIVGNDKIKLEVIKDGFSNPVLKVACGNLKVALDIRNFFAAIIFNEFINYVPDEEFISLTFYTTVENIQKAVKNFIIKNLDPEEFTPLAERFERNVIGALPI